MKLRQILITLLVVAGMATAWADSPLTSTHFAQCYGDVPMVARAMNHHAVEMPDDILQYLADATQPVDQRVAAVNAVGWNFDGLPNGNKLLTLLCERDGYGDIVELANQLDPGTLCVLAYTCAMSDYFNVETAMWLGNRAMARNRYLSFTIEMVAAMIRAQYYLDHDIARVGRTAREVIDDPILKHDMRQCAVDGIMEYLDLY